MGDPSFELNKNNLGGVFGDTSFLKALPYIFETASRLVVILCLAFFVLFLELMVLSSQPQVGKNRQRRSYVAIFAPSSLAVLLLETEVLLLRSVGGMAA